MTFLLSILSNVALNSKFPLFDLWQLDAGVRCGSATESSFAISLSDSRVVGEKEGEFTMEYAYTTVFIKYAWKGSALPAPVEPLVPSLVLHCILCEPHFIRIVILSFYVFGGVDVYTISKSPRKASFRGGVFRDSVFANFECILNTNWNAEVCARKLLLSYAGLAILTHLWCSAMLAQMYCSAHLCCSFMLAHLYCSAILAHTCCSAHLYCSFTLAELCRLTYAVQLYWLTYATLSYAVQLFYS